MKVSAVFREIFVGQVGQVGLARKPELWHKITGVSHELFVGQVGQVGQTR